MDKTMRCLFRLIGLVTAVCWLAIPCYAVEQTEKQVVSAELEKSGKQLRVELDAIYKQLRIGKKYIDHYDISDVMLKYIKVGDSFDVASRILQAAGFSIWPRPIKNTRNLCDTHAIVAGATLDKQFAFEAGVMVTIHPEYPGVMENKVKKINASIHYAGL